MRFSSGTWVYVDHPAQLLQLPLGNLPTEECVEVRARDSAGRRSEPWVRCVTEAQLRLESDPSRNDMFVCDRPEVQALLTREVAGAESSLDQPTPSSDAGPPDDEDGAAPSHVDEAAVPIGEGAGGGGAPELTEESTPVDSSGETELPSAANLRSAEGDAPTASAMTDAGIPSLAPEPRAQAVDDTQDDGGCAFTAPSARSRGSLGLLYLAVALGGVAFHRRCRRVCGTVLAE